MNKPHRVISSLIVATASLAALSSAQAQDGTSGLSGDLYGAGKSYIGLNAGQSDFRIGSGSGIFESDNHDTAYNAYAGNYFSYNFGFEFGYTDFGQVNRAGGRTKANGANLSLIGKLPLGDAFNLLGKVGTLYGRTDVSSASGSGVTAGNESGFGWSYGVGVEYKINPQWSAVLQYGEHELKFPGDERDRIGVATLGVRYRF